MRAYCRQHYKTDYELLKPVPGIAGITASYIPCGGWRFETIQ